MAGRPALFERARRCAWAGTGALLPPLARTEGHRRAGVAAPGAAGTLARQSGGAGCCMDRGRAIWQRIAPAPSGWSLASARSLVARTFCRDICGIVADTAPRLLRL